MTRGGALERRPHSCQDQRGFGGAPAERHRRSLRTMSRPPRMGSPPPAPGPARRVLRLRLQASDGEHVALDTGALPDNVYDVTSLLMMETAPRAAWRDTAAAYISAGRLDAGVAVLEEATSDKVDAMLGEAGGRAASDARACSRVDLLAALAGAYVMRAEAASDRGTREELLRRTAGVFGRADLIDANHHGVWTVKGAAEAAAGRAAQAKDWFDNAHSHGGDVAAALGLAQCALNASPPEPRRAADVLAAALHAAPCPGSAWTALGHALFRAGDVKTARTVLRRAVKAVRGSAPRERLEALYALARVESAEPTPLAMENAVAALREAYLVCGGDRDARVLTMLAEFYFVSGHPEAALPLVDRAVAAAEAPASGGDGDGGEDDGGVDGGGVGAGGGGAGGDAGGGTGMAGGAAPSGGGPGGANGPDAGAKGGVSAVGSGGDSREAMAGIRRTVRAQALCERARVRLTLDDVDGATADYEAAKAIVDEARSIAGAAPVVVNPGLYLRLGLLKLSSSLGHDVMVAEECLEKILSSFDERCFVAMRGLGVIIGRRVIDSWNNANDGDGEGKKAKAAMGGRIRGGEKHHRARDLLRRGIEGDAQGKKDVAALLVYAALVEESDPALALSMHETAVAALEAAADEANGKEVERVRAANEARMSDGDGSDGEKEVAVYKPAEIPYEVHANMAALLGRLRRVSEARKLFQEKLDKDVVAESLDLSYNAALLAELDGDYSTASAGFKAILERDPDFHAARLRLGHMAVTQDKEFDKAEEIFKKVQATETHWSAVASAYLNKLYIETKNPNAQQTLLESNRGHSDYMTVAFAQFMHSHLAGVGTADRRHRFLLNHIAVPLQQVLKRNKRNVYAANGVGVFFAENGMMSEARDAFSAAGSNGDIALPARVNLAHTTVSLAKAAVRAKNEATTIGVRYSISKLDSARGLCEQAGKLYSDAEQLASEQGSQDRAALMDRMEILLYRADAKHHVGAFRQSADLLEKILESVPESAPVWFNLGQVLRECAGERVLRSAKNLDEMLKAKDELKSCAAAFANAAQFDKGIACPVTRSRVDRKFLDHHAKFVAQVIKSHEVSIINARNDAEDNERMRLDKIEEVKRLNEKRELRAAQKRKEEEDRKAAMAKAAAEARERFEKQQAERLERLRNPPRESDDESAGANDGTSGGEGSSKPRGKRRKRSKEGGEKVKPSKRRKSVKKEKAPATEFESSDEYGNEDFAEVESGSPAKKSGRKRAVAASDSDDNSDMETGPVRSAKKSFNVAPDSDSSDVDDDVKNLVADQTGDGDQDAPGAEQDDDGPGAKKAEDAPSAKKGEDARDAKKEEDAVGAKEEETKMSKGGGDLGTAPRDTPAGAALDGKQVNGNAVDEDKMAD